jgi:DNA polymerase III epsilon subunit-like protein
MRKVLLLDTETTGLDFANDRITEIGAMVVSEDFQDVEEGFNTLVWDQSYPVITEEITELTGITTAELVEAGESPAFAFNEVTKLIQRHEVEKIIAYNEEFDRNMWAAELNRQGLPIEQGMAINWACALKDHKPNYKCKSWKLMHVALDHGVPVDPSTLHRAIADVELMRQMLVASGATLDKLLAYRNSPYVYLRAKVQKPWEDGGKSTDLAKAHGFSWEKAKGDSRVFEKTWVRRIKECDLKEVGQFPFQTATIGAYNANVSN